MIKGSNDNETWIDLLSKSIPTFTSTTDERELEIPAHENRLFKYFRFYVNQTAWLSRGSSGGYLQMRALRMC